MKKLLCVLLLLLLPMSIKADGTIYYEETTGVEYNNGEITLTNYTYEGAGIYETYAIYAEEDLVLTLVGENNIPNSSIYVGGKLTLKGEGSLNLKALKYDSMKIEGGTINISDLENSYFNIRPDFPFYGSYLKDGVTYGAIFNDFPDEGNQTFYDSYFLNPVDNITLTTYKLANIDNLYKEEDVYFLNPLTSLKELRENVEGFVILNPSPNSSVTYNNVDTYYVSLWNDYYEDGYSRNPLEFIFNLSEFSKLVEFEVLQANNFYYFDYDGSYKKIEQGQTIKEWYEYVGHSSVYSKTIDGDNDIGSIYLELFAKKNNSIVLKMIGSNGTYKYINLQVKDEEEPEKPIIPIKPERHEIPNTGVKSD